MFREITRFVADNAKHPFFLYWATPIPHVAIQAPQRWVDHYIQKFGPETPYLAADGMGYFPHRNPRAGYAAMISYLDENIGKLVKQLKDAGVYEDTLIIFTSDNGPSYAGGADPEWFQSARPFDGRYGRGKGFVYEGGIRVPMIASWPGKIEPGSRSNLISAQYDVGATLAELTGFEVQGPQDGISFLPTLLDKGEQAQHEFLYWEFPEYGGQVAIRMGNWKVVRQNLRSGKGEGTLELYDLDSDPGEQHNMAGENPAVIAHAAKLFSREHLPPEVEKFRMPAIENGLLSGN
jgi:arylsulfatase